MIEFIQKFFDNETNVLILICTIKGLAIPLVPLTLVAFLVLFERKCIGWLQERPGPNRVGPWGILQGFVDAGKLLFKEDLMPKGANPLLFNLAPAIVIIVSFLTIAVVPFGPPIELGGQTFALSMTDSPLALLFFFAIGSLSIYGLVIAGWSSNNKWSLLGGLRSSAQMISYEIALSMALIGVLLLSGTFNLGKIVEGQGGGMLNWYVWQQPLGCLLFFIAMIAEVNRLPFDLPEGESELTGGFHTEYSTMKFSMFFMGEYIGIFTMSAVFATLFWGGYYGPIHLNLPSWLGVLSGIFWIMAKIGFVFFCFVWMRGTLPRLRYDQLMNLGWKIMFPLSLLNLMVTAAVIAGMNDGFLRKAVLFVLGAGIILIVDQLIVQYRRKTLHAA